MTTQRTYPCSVELSVVTTEGQGKAEEQLLWHSLFLGDLTEAQARWVYSELETKAQEVRRQLEQSAQGKE